MEAVGAAASIIAIGQAVQVLVQFTLYLKSLRGLGNQADALMLELQYFQMYSEELQRVADFLNSIADHDADNNAGVLSDLNSELISATQQEMQNFVQAVEEFQKSCEKLRPKNHNNTAKFAWLKLILKKNDLQELKERAHSVRPRFQETISVLMSYQQRKQTGLLLDLVSISCTIRNQTTTIISNQNSSPRLAIEDSQTSILSSGSGMSTGVQVARRRKKKPGAQRSREITDTTITTTNNNTTYPRNRNSADANREFVRRLQSSPIFSDRVEPSAAARSHASDFSDYETDDSFIDLQAQLVAECLPGCRCACHVKRTDINWDAGKIWPVLQGCAFQYSSAPLVYRPACTYTPCKRSRKSTVAVSLKVPVWLCSKMLYMRTSIDSLSCLGSRLSFRCGRQDFGFSLHSMLYSTVCELQSKMRRHGVIYPWDIIGGLQVQTIELRPSIFEFLMQLWRPILRDAELDRRMFYNAYDRYLAYKRGEIHNLPSIYEESLQYDSNPPTIRETRTHRAIRNLDLAELVRALEQDPMDTQTFDFNGEAPIHIAARLGDVAALHILIAAGGSIDQGDIHNNAPLYKAACNDQAAFVQALVKLGCDYDKGISSVCSRVSGSTSPASIIILRTLIALHPKITQGSWLGLDRCKKYPIAREKLDILLERKEILEDAATFFWELAESFIQTKNSRMLAYLFHHKWAMRMSGLGWLIHWVVFEAVVFTQSKMLRILDRQCLWGVNVYALKRHPTLLSVKSVSVMRQLVNLVLSIRNRTLDTLIFGIRDFISRAILPREKDDFAIQNLRRLQEIARTEEKDSNEEEYTLSHLSNSLDDILRAVAKSRWQDAEEATRDLLDRLEDIRSSDIWLLVGRWGGPEKRFERHEVWDYGSDDEDEDQNEEESVDDEQERENPWIGTEIRYVRL